jgi:uncharacterized protein (TIGR02271 family)
LAKQRSDRFTELEERYAGYEVYDRHYEKIGKVDDLFVDENDNPEYIGVKTGFLGTRSTLIPMETVRVDEERRVVEVPQPKSKVKEGPAFDDGEEVTPEYEERVRDHYGLRSARGSAERGAYGHYHHANEKRTYAERVEGSERHPGVTDEEELRVRRSEEELRAGTREREAGGLRVRKRVRTERERVRVPKKREEVRVDRVPVEEGREASEAEIGEDEFFVPVTEEEIVVEKRPVVKEEIRLRKEVVEDEEVVEEDVRREEVDMDDRTGRRGTLGRDAHDETRRRDG